MKNIAVYKIPVTPESLHVRYNDVQCNLVQKSESSYFKCNDVFLKVHGNNYLLVPSGEKIKNIEFYSKAPCEGLKKLNELKKEILMNPIESDYVDVHGGNQDTR